MIFLINEIIYKNKQFNAVNESESNVNPIIEINKVELRTAFNGMITKKGAYLIKTINSIIFQIEDLNNGVDYSHTIKKLELLKTETKKYKLFVSFWSIIFVTLKNSNIEIKVVDI